MSYKDALASIQHFKQARTANTIRNSRNVTSAQKPTAANAVAEIFAEEKVGCAEVMSHGKPAEDGFITVTKKKHGDVGTVKSRTPV